MIGKNGCGHSVFIVEDDESIRRLIRDELAANEFETDEAGDLKGARERLNQQTFDAVLLDLRLPDGNGLELFDSFPDKLKNRTIVITANGTISSAVDAVKKGAVNYLEKPFDERVLPHQLINVIESNLVKEKYRCIKSEITSEYTFSDIVCESRQMEEVIERAKILAETDNIILIEGETGVGKEILSLSIHNHSRRRREVFMPINCAALPSELVESELFGYEKGAFTGAVDSYSGRFIQANNGTLFLDEIGDLPPFVQAKLLRVIDDQTVYRLKSRIPKKLDIRTIAATNKNLQEEVREKNFREDLFYRLQESVLYIPPLRERREDIIPLFRHFLSRFNTVYNRNVTRVSRESEEFLLRHEWPGNVRQLKNLLKGIIPFKKDDCIGIDDIVFPMRKNPAAGGRKILSLEEHEKEYISEIYSMSGSNASKAARLLNISLPTLYKKLRG